MKQSFAFLCKPSVIWGEGSVEALPGEIRRLGGAKAFVVADAGFAATAAFRGVMDLLSRDGIPVEVWDGIRGEPAAEEGDAAAAAAKKAGCDIVVGIGGGSALDTAKAVSVLVTNTGTVRDYQGLDKVPNPGVPKIMVPTTAGTGSEVTFTAVFIRRDEKKKGGINSRHLYPDSAILDPRLTLTVPPPVTAATGLDALCHAVESYLSRKATFLTEPVSVEAVRLIWTNLPKAVADRADPEARARMLYASFLAGVGLANAGVTAVHSISYPLGGTYGIAHGTGNALLLPAVLRFNLPAAGEKMGRLAAVLDPAWASLPADRAGAMVVDRIQEFLSTFKVPRLAALGVPADAYPSLAEDALKVSVPIENNPRPVSKNDIVEIYRASA